MYEITIVRENKSVYKTNISLKDARDFDFSQARELMNADAEYVSANRGLEQILRDKRRKILER